MLAFKETYEAACESGLLPGVVLLAASKDGRFNYKKTLGFRSLSPGDSFKQPMESNTVLAVASCTKLMTSIAALQCVERGLFKLDEDVSPVLPEVGKFGIITGFDEAAGQPIMASKTKPISIRQLLSHTSGYQYDMTSPLLEKWRVSRGEALWSGPTVEEKTALPLVFEPGTSWAYGGGYDWAGKMIERVTGETLDIYMSKNIWGPLGIKDITFWPKERADMKDRMADMSVLNPDSGKAVDLPGFDVNFGATDCIGGGGAFASAEAYVTLLQAVMREDSKLLNPQSYEELFKPQLDAEQNKAFHDLQIKDPNMRNYLSINVPTSGHKNWSFGGLLSLDEYPGWMKKNSLLWGGVPNIIWFIDREAGLCGMAACQVIPPMIRPYLDLHEQFQRGIYELYAAS